MKKATKGIAPQVTPKYEFISPARAEQLLNHNNANRHLRPGIVEKYAADMTGGTWTTCTAPIVIYKDGEIADGQHRLWAITESKVGQHFLILRGLSREAGLNIDMGLNRSLVDNARISGADPDLSISLISLARAIAEGDRANVRARTLTNTQRLGFVETHREAAKFAIHNGGKGRGLNNSIVNGAIARAWYAEADKERLAAFGKVYSTGFMDLPETDSAAIALRNYFQATPGLVTNAWRDTFIKSQNAVWYFMRKRKLFVIKGLADERYPLKGAK